MPGPPVADGLPEWAEWRTSKPYSIGIEEEVMLLKPDGWGLAHRAEDILARLPATLESHATAETHQAVIELATSPHRTVEETAREAVGLRAALAQALRSHGLSAAGAGTHPLAVWTETQVSPGARYQVVYESMRELARREPTFALHVHIGVVDPERAMILQNRLRTHLPFLLAISANSPFWQGRDTGLASTRTPIFQAFPRVGIPRAFASYADYVAVVDGLLRCDAFPAPTFLWWDVRLQPTLGTVEVRIMDAQTTADESCGLAALVQTIAHLELEEGYHDPRLIDAYEILQENRFLAARDGVAAGLLDPIAERKVPVRRMLEDLLDAGRDHAQELGCESALDEVTALVRANGAVRQRELAGGRGLSGVIGRLSSMFTGPVPR
ncbi:MAG TPA: YbdK family carboxylate-amine ligase [Solirubrobacteraceae bacterium]|nr:YbdK family carboxylate-amine ligase [Solirubrobacteraceae bacterium]